MNHNKNFIKRLYSKLETSEISEKDYAKLKNEFSAEFWIPNVKNIELIEAYRKLIKDWEVVKNKEIENLIKRRKIRSESWVSVVACQTKPFDCPWKCVYCPSEPNMPKSYLSNQPASMRAVLNKFDPFNQVQNRLASLMVTGHDTSKIEVIVIWWTWSYLPLDYQKEFIKSVYDALNQKINIENVETYGTFFKCPKIENKTTSKTLEESIKKNETADYRCVWLTLETRPDFITEDEIKRFREYWCTRVELWVQSLFDEVHIKTKRGHTVQDIRNATRLLRDAGFKFAYHIMPWLPWSTPKMDLETVQMMFNDEDFKPDWVKFYPCVVTPFSELSEIYKRGEFKPMVEEDLKPIIIEMKKLVPRFCRIIRVARDIPSESVIAGLKNINLRQLIHQDMKKMWIECNCIRCREIKSNTINKYELKRVNYKANGWDEIFLSFDETEQDKLISLLRLRVPSQYFTKEKHFIPELEWCSLIREVHTYGSHTAIGNKDGNTQHFGFGRKMLEEAERITKEEYKLDKIAVISWVGVRGYYEKNGYKLVGTYMVKEL